MSEGRIILTRKELISIKSLLYFKYNALLDIGLYEDAEKYRVILDKLTDYKPARLVNANPYGECSNCGALIDSRDGFGYCPYCGVKLGENNHE